MKREKNKEISIFDVKELRDAAEDEKQKAQCSLRRYRQLMRKAEKLEGRYRAQLKTNQYQYSYK